MPYDLPLSDGLKQAGWKVKVLDKEPPREEPHVTIFRKQRKWRYGIRRGEFLDRVPSPRDVPDEVLNAIRADHANVAAYWDRVHPHNPIGGGA